MIEAARLAAIEVVYGKAPPGSIGHSLVELAAEVSRLRAQLAALRQSPQPLTVQEP